MSDKVDVYEIVTEKVLTELESGNVPWRKPWTDTSAPRSLSTGKPYTGMNVFLLLCENRESPWWGTWKQIENRGGKVLPDQRKKSTIVIYWNMRKVYDKHPDTGEKVVRVVPLLRYYRVYNLDQTEGVTLTDKEKALTETATLSEADRIDAADKIVSNYVNAPRISHDGGDGAYYRPFDDSIHLPSFVDFEVLEEYYATLFHEMIHSTGHKSRLARHTKTAFFGNHEYGREELVAEMGSAFLASEAGFLERTVENTAAYLRSWMRVLKDDKHAVVVAAGAAQKATDYILGRVREQKEDEA